MDTEAKLDITYYDALDVIEGMFNGTIHFDRHMARDILRMLHDGTVLHELLDTYKIDAAVLDTVDAAVLVDPVLDQDNDDLSIVPVNNKKARKRPKQGKRP